MDKQILKPKDLAEMLNVTVTTLQLDLIGSLTF